MLGGSSQKPALPMLAWKTINFKLDAKLLSRKYSRKAKRACSMNKKGHILTNLPQVEVKTPIDSAILKFLE